MMSSSANKPLLWLAVSIALLAFNGCSHKRNDDAEQMGTAIPSLSAKSTFFDGKILVEANLGRGFHAGNGGPGGGPGGHGHHGFGGGPGGPGGGPGGPGGGPESSEGEERGLSIHEVSLPPVALRLRVTNTSKETVDIAFLVCKSELGDFAVRPEKIALAPDQVAEPDAMTSTLGLTTTQLVLHLSLRSGGKVEHKDLTLQPKGQTGE